MKEIVVWNGFRISGSLRWWLWEYCTRTVKECSFSETKLFFADVQISLEYIFGKIVLNRFENAELFFVYIIDYFVKYL